MSAYLAYALKRNVLIVNLDPANDAPPYLDAYTKVNPASADITGIIDVLDVRELISAEDVADAFGLGPNGALIYCMEFIEKNHKWIKDSIHAKRLAITDKIHERRKAAGAGANADLMPCDLYVLFDLPGQVELYVHHTSTKRLVERMTSKWDYRVG